ncbi:response regulator receiver [Oscillochloris trichoides DG-6]|uniref:Response regulator receiver n=1 Tax=Oscillochloris trichoides DG-6 TaxID=765420 RepID=E1IEE3_9CHLR|nr:response regulator [Oscillochloris trichoides]EFO80469.1 response regulator receiver [Oscillochloris trichoides DG-6]
MKTILVVDDNTDNRNIIAQMLKISGFQVVCAINGVHALEVAASERPDLIMMDMAMPVMDGWSATGHLKADPELNRIPVIAVTGHVTQNEINRALNMGCEDVITKPIDFETMIQKVRRYATRHMIVVQ